MSEWTEYKLGDIAKFQTGKLNSNAAVKNGKFPFFTCSPETYRIDDYAFDQKAILLAGNNAEGNFNIKYYEGKFNAYQRTYVISPACEEINILYLFYALQLCLHKFKQLSQGTSTKFLTAKILNAFTIQVPSKFVQKKIACIIKALDDKIENNRRVNENLEQQAQALFKSWFVDFEPFKDGEFVESELGMIPKTIETKYVSDIPHILETGRRPKGGVGELTSGIPSVGAEHVKGMGKYDFSKTKYIPEEYAATLKAGKVKGYELLIYKDGGKPGYFIPNFSIFGEGYPFDECYLNEHVFKLDFDNRGYNIFCYFYFQTDHVMTYLNAQGGKAAIPGINKQDIENILTYSPESEQVKKFGTFAEPLFKKILYNCKESQMLATIRDTLLPKLMSGELRVPDTDLINEMLDKGIR